MAEALYAPGRGYYTRYGAGRDYRSAPQTSPAFGHLIGRALTSMWRAVGRPGRLDVLELGRGGGRARDDRDRSVARARLRPDDRLRRAWRGTARAASHGRHAGGLPPAPRQRRRAGAQGRAGPDRARRLRPTGARRRGGRAAHG